MGIEWTKIEKKPQKKHKIEGAELLALRKKVESLESQLLEKKQEISSLSGKTEGIKTAMESTVSEKDKELQQLLSKKKDLENDFEQQVQSLSSENQELKSELTQYKSKFNDLEKEKKEIARQRKELQIQLDIMDDELKSRDFNYFKKFVRERAERASQSSLELPDEE